jgi:hypothetical protein
MDPPTYTSVQLIDENKQFHDGVNRYLEQTNTHNCGLGYHVVSVFGSQSTGKSTLLNYLFGTRFNVMNESQRSQTTKGIWLAKAVMSAEAEALSDEASSTRSSSDDFVDVVASSSNILVLDVEGTDGRERGEDQDFERRSALFALATSEVLIVNMWENQVGLYQGANMGLLKTVFEVNLSLFQTSGEASRSLILFVIRDHLGSTPIENLSQTLLQDLNKHWDSIAKPTEALKESKISDFFDIQFQTLPHKILLPDRFREEVATMSLRFINPHSPSYVFQPEYHRKVPIDGWGIYAEQVWEQIELNKDLDLPTQQMLVARFRCEEISGQAYSEFESGLAEIQQKTGGALGGEKVVESFGSSITSIRTNALEHYDSLSSRYQESVYHAKRKDLLSRIDSNILNLYKAQLLALHKSALSAFQNAVNETGDGSQTFAEIIVGAKAGALKIFLDGANEATVDNRVFNFSQQLAAFNSELDSLEADIKQKQIDKIVQKINKKIARIFSEYLDSFFVDPDSETWGKVVEFFNSTYHSALAPYDKGDDFKVAASRESNRRGANEIRRTAWISLDTRLRDITREDNVVMRLRENFEKSFRYDKKEVPIIWKPNDDIETPYLKSRDHALSLLPIFSQAILPDGSRLEPDMVLDEDSDEDFALRIPEHRQQEIAAKFRRQADAVYVEAKRSTSLSTMHVPFYIIVLIVLLGWNEFMAVLRNPCK